MDITTVALHHRVEGAPDAPPVFLGGSLGTSLAVWDRVAADLAYDHRVVRFDTRGHGASPVPPGPYSLSALAADVVALADKLGVDRFAYVGLSLGGAIGLTLALEHADRLTALVLCGTAATFGDAATWRQRAKQVSAEGTGPLVEPTTGRWFTDRFRSEHPDEVSRIMAMLASSPNKGYAACCEANAGYDVTDRLGEVRTPTLVVAGSEDATAGPEAGRMLADGIPGADLVVVDGAAHLVNVAAPDIVVAAVREHLRRTQPA